MICLGTGKENPRNRNTRLHILKLKIFTNLIKGGFVQNTSDCLPHSALRFLWDSIHLLYGFSYSLVAVMHN